MKVTNVSVVIAITAALVGCASGPSPAERAHRQALQQENRKAEEARNEESRKAEEARILQIKQNLPKLRPGMMLTEVEATIGPIKNKDLLELVSLGAVMAQVQGGQFTATVNGNSTVTCDQGFCVLNFDNKGKFLGYVLK